MQNNQFDAIHAFLRQHASTDAMQAAQRAVAAGPHPTDDLLYDYAVDAIEEAIAGVIRQHLLWCPACLHEVLMIRAGEQEIAENLSADRTLEIPVAITQKLKRLTTPAQTAPPIAASELRAQIALEYWVAQSAQLEEIVATYGVLRYLQIVTLIQALHTNRAMSSRLGIPLGGAGEFSDSRKLDDYRSIKPYFSTNLPVLDVVLMWEPMPYATQYQLVFEEEHNITVLAQMTPNTSLILSEGFFPEQELKEDCRYTWKVRGLDEKARKIDESDVQGVLRILNQEQHVCVTNALASLPAEGNPEELSFLRGICWQEVGCRFHALQAYHAALSIRSDYLPAVNGMIECLEGSYDDLTKNGCYTGTRWDDIVEMYKLKRCILLGHSSLRDQRKCAECQACVETRKDE